MNTLTVNGATYHLVHVGGGQATHLADACTDLQVKYRTLCGRDAWHLDEDAVSPSCRRCLSCLDAKLPTPPKHPGLATIIELVVGAVRDHGTAEITGVPGDQLTHLRRGIREAVRQELGFNARTFSRDGLVVVSSDEAMIPHQSRHMQEAARRMDAIFSGRDLPPIDDSDWRFRWSTWAVD